MTGKVELWNFSFMIKHHKAALFNQNFSVEIKIIITFANKIFKLFFFSDFLISVTKSWF